MTNADTTERATGSGLPARHISSLYIALLAVAMVVGGGIFKSPSVVAGASGSTEWFFAAWVLGGLISLIGALCYAELSTAFPNAGGDYGFLRTAFGRHLAFLFAWARFAVINTGSIAMLGFVLGDYMNAAIPLGAHGAAIYALTAIVGLTIFNLRGVHGGTRADYALTSLEVLGLLILASAALWLVVQGAPPQTASAAATGWPPASFGVALVFVLLAFGGWTEIATLSAEVRDARRGMVRALVLAIVLITILYLLVNWAFWRGLGLEGLAASKAPAADLMGAAFGANAGLITAIAIALATITSINATIVVGGRTTYAAGTDWPLLNALGTWDAARGIPARAILAQSAVAIGLVGYGALQPDGFRAMVDYVSPVYWAFILLSGIAVMVLRVKRPDVERPFRVPLFPLLPILFCGSAVFVLQSSVGYVMSQGGLLLSFAVLGLGVFVMLGLELGRRRA